MLEEKCLEYVQLLDYPPNGWNQHIHPTYGQSHVMLRWLFNEYGENVVKDWLRNYYAKTT